MRKRVGQHWGPTLSSLLTRALGKFASSLLAKAIAPGSLKGQAGKLRHKQPTPSSLTPEKKISYLAKQGQTRSSRRATLSNQSASVSSPGLRWVQAKENVFFGQLGSMPQFITELCGLGQRDLGRCPLLWMVRRMNDQIVGKQVLKQSLGSTWACGPCFVIAL